MEQTFSKLEQAILDWASDYYKDEVFSNQVKSARFISREWTKCGYFIQVEVDKTLPKINTAELVGRSLSPVLDGPHITSPQIESGGSSIIWADCGYIESIEMQSHGGSFGKEVTVFKLESSF